MKLKEYAKNNKKVIAIVLVGGMLLSAIAGSVGYIVGGNNAIKVDKLIEYRPNEVIAKVGNKTIKGSELQLRLDTLVALNGAEGVTEEVKKELDKSLREYAINSEVLYQEAQKKGMKLTDEEKKSHYESMKGQVEGMFGISYDEFLKKFDTTDTVVKEGIEKELLASKYLQKETMPTEEAMKEQFESNKEDYKLVRASHILIGDDHDTEGHKHMEDKDVKKKAEEVLKQVQEGGDFEAIAKKESIDKASAENGGDLDFFSKGMMVEPFEKEAFSLKNGEISGLVQTDFGYHIIKKTDEKVRTYDEVKEQIQYEMQLDNESKVIEEARKDIGVK